MSFLFLTLWMSQHPDPYAWVVDCTDVGASCVGLSDVAAMTFRIDPPAVGNTLEPTDKLLEWFDKRNSVAYVQENGRCFVGAVEDSGPLCRALHALYGPEARANLRRVKSGR